jgi:hypothetical protein
MKEDRLWSSGLVVRVRIPDLPDFPRSNGSETGSTPQKLALTSPTSGCRSIIIIRSRIRRRDLFIFSYLNQNHSTLKRKRAVIYCIYIYIYSSAEREFARKKCIVARMKSCLNFPTSVILLIIKLPGNR